MITKNQPKRITSQKRIILDFLRKTKSHPNAKVIWEEIRSKLPQISLATVYRILDSFKEMEIPISTPTLSAQNAVRFLMF